nr:retrotransposon protein, putative, Ty1-copia subclass [Tanacetum cinerariifolium]
MTPELHRQIKNSSPYDMIKELKSIFEKQAGVERQTGTSWLGKKISELHAMLIEYEKGLLKKAETSQVMMIKGVEIQKAKKKSLKAKARKKKQDGSASSSGIFIIELFDFPNKSWVYDTSCGTHICITKHGFREARKLKQGALYLYVGNGVRAQVEEIGSFDLILPNGLVICLDNCHYAPSITRVSKNNVFYFNAISSNGIYEIDMHDLVQNVNSIYTVSTKRAKHNLDSTYLWHCRLAHISKKRIEKVQQEGLLKSIDDESFDQCVSCLSGKMTRKSFLHRLERATDLLGIIHTDVCGPLRHVSRQGASYFITFTDEYSCYGYVYLLKHKNEVFETFKVFKNEVDNQLRKTIKALRSERGGEYISQEFKDYLKAYGIVQQLTPPYTPQHNGVSERRNRTLLDMVRSLMNLTTLLLSFWDYALYEIPMEAEGFEPPQEEVIPIRRSVRTQRAPDCLCLNVEVEEHSLGDLNEHASYKATMLDLESNK